MLSDFYKSEKAEYITNQVIQKFTISLTIGIFFVFLDYLDYQL